MTIFADDDAGVQSTEGGEVSNAVTNWIAADFDERMDQIMAGVKVEDLSGADRITLDWNPDSYEGAIAALYVSVLRRIRAKKAFLATFGSEKAIEELSGEHEAQWWKSRNRNLNELNEFYVLRNSLKAALVSIRMAYSDLPVE